jgi:hypothetical protein
MLSDTNGVGKPDILLAERVGAETKFTDPIGWLPFAGGVGASEIGSAVGQRNC